MSIAQVANRPDQFMVLANRIDEVLKGGRRSLLKIDIKNAFNSIPHSVITWGLEAINIDEKLKNYILKMLKSRKADIDVQLKTGVPQGDPLSMLLFIIAINPLIMLLGKEFGEGSIVAYADDILITGKKNFTETDISKVVQLAGYFGLKVNREKCQMINKEDETQILFAGVPLTTTERVQRVEEITSKYKKELQNLENLEIPQHHKLILFQACVNHEQLFHMFVEKSDLDSWEDANKAAIDYLQKILGIDDLPTELVELSWELGGLDTILPNTQKLAVNEWKKQVAAQ